MSKVHSLKTTLTWFDRVAAGEKTAEIRKHDRDFQTGDHLHLVATWPTDGTHIEEGSKVWHTKGRETGESVAAVITHVLPADQFPEGLQDGYCLLSMRLLTKAAK